MYKINMQVILKQARCSGTFGEVAACPPVVLCRRDDIGHAARPRRVRTEVGTRRVRWVRSLAGGVLDDRTSRGTRRT